MRIARKLVACWMSFATIVVLLAWFATSPSVAAAQAGWNAVCNGTSCGTPVASSSFIDASRFLGDICGQIFSALNSNNTLVHPVIDARGITSNLTCTGVETPWTHSIATVNFPSTILLPAGKIITDATWVLPSETKLIGVGASDPGDANANRVETIIAGSNNLSGSILQMGSNSVCPQHNVNNHPCFGIGISHLTLNGPTSTNSVDGIDNFNAEEGSFVEHVNMYNISATGLKLGTATSDNASANHSGPYSDIWYAANQMSSSAACVRIEGTQPRGIHGITCAGSPTNTPEAAIYLDGQNVSIEDVPCRGLR